LIYKGASEEDKMEVSNKTLAWFVVAAIAVSIIGTSISLTRLGNTGMTGYAVSNATGNASISVSKVTQLRFAISTLDFGSGSVETGSYNNCTLTANDGTTGTLGLSAGCLGFNDAAGQVWPLVLENAGNTRINVTLNFSDDNTTFPGGTLFPLERSFRYMVENNETNSCTGTLGVTAWTEVTALTTSNVCTDLSYTPTTNTLRLNLQVVVPMDATGDKIVTILAQGTSED
jgi:hypothetical protein